ncbi:hypothetical protein R1flu_017139 [Riccia fluitans]|uniref:Uncharacterized protein n=1 Tax=Riccia fluitans TaxID=41844 RepID=A0ABD1YPE4_9MARC
MISRYAPSISPKAVHALCRFRRVPSVAEVLPRGSAHVSSTPRPTNLSYRVGWSRWVTFGCRPSWRHGLVPIQVAGSDSLLAASEAVYWFCPIRHVKGSTYVCREGSAKPSACPVCVDDVLPATLDCARAPRLCGSGHLGIPARINDVSCVLCARFIILVALHIPFANEPPAM